MVKLLVVIQAKPPSCRHVARLRGYDGPLGDMKVDGCTVEASST